MEPESYQLTGPSLAIRPLFVTVGLGLRPVIRVFVAAFFVSNWFLLVTPTCAVAQCIGDCNGDGRVAVDELVLAVRIILDAVPVERCTTLDANRNRVVTVDDLVSAVNDSLSGCPLGIQITQPSIGLLTPLGTIDVSGTVDRRALAVEVNGVAAELANGSFARDDVPLREGLNTVTAIVRDADGRMGAARVTVVRDSTPPSVTIETPVAGQDVSSSTVTIVGSVHDAVTGTVNGNDPEIVVTGRAGSHMAAVRNGTFLAESFPLVPGPNTISVQSTDAAGNVSDAAVVTIRRIESNGQRIEIISGDNQSGRVGQQLNQPIIARAVDADGNGLAGRSLRFRVTRNNGRVRAAGAADGATDVVANTDAGGFAAIEWELGSRAGSGNNRLVVSALGFASQLVCASAEVNSCERLLVLSGENQLGLPRTSLAHPFEVLAVDAEGNACAGIPITFRVEQGGGNFAGEVEVSTISNTDGRAAALLTLGTEVAPNGQNASASISNVDGSKVSFSATAAVTRVSAPTRVVGTVLDTDNTPIPNANVWVETAISGTQGTTDENGHFILEQAPVGSAVLYVDGSTTTRPGRWPALEFQIDVLPGIDNSLGRPVFLPKLNDSGFRVVGGPDDVVLEMGGVEGFKLKIFANSATFFDGSKTGSMGVTQVSNDKIPMPPGGGAAPPWAGTLQPANVTLDPPAQLTVPNSLGLPPGQIVDILSFDHDLMQYVSAGTGTVQPDAATIVSDPGSGLSESGWFYDSPPPPPATCVDGCGPCEICANGQCVAAGRADVSAEVIDQDDAENFVFRPLGGNPGIAYGGSVSATSDNLKVITASSQNAQSYTWSVAGPGSAAYTLPPPSATANEWDIGDLDPVPGVLTFSLRVDLMDGGSCQSDRQVEVGIRTDHFVSLGWINSDEVPLPTSGVSADVLEYFPPGGLAGELESKKFATLAYLGLVAANVLTRPVVPAPLTAADRTYILDWLFFWSANFCPGRCPSSDFADSSAVPVFAAERATSYKLLNDLQIKYRTDGRNFLGAPQIIRRRPGTGVGRTNDPIFGREDPGRPGPANNQLVANNEIVRSVNEGTPAGLAVSAFNNLAGAPLKWNHIGSRIELGVPYRTGARICAQVYPTYYIYRNEADSVRLVHVESLVQAPEPIDNFNDNPYSPIDPPYTSGPAPFIAPDRSNCIELR